MIEETVIARLEEAGRTILAMPGADMPNLGFRTADFGFVHEAVVATKFNMSSRIRASVPSAAAITRMDEAYAWLRFIPDDRHIVRRIVGARSLVNPISERHTVPWRRLSAMFGMDYRMIQTWHHTGIKIIAGRLRTHTDKSRVEFNRNSVQSAFSLLHPFTVESINR